MTFDDLDSACAEVDRLTKERDAERELHRNLESHYHAGVRRVCASGARQVTTLTDERDALRAECERMRAVYEAAVKFCISDGDSDDVFEAVEKARTP